MAHATGGGRGDRRALPRSTGGRIRAGGRVVRAALDTPDALPVSRPRGFVFLADIEMRLGNHESAIPPLEDWSESVVPRTTAASSASGTPALGEPHRAVMPLEKALSIRPSAGSASTPTLPKPTAAWARSARS